MNFNLGWFGVVNIKMFCLKRVMFYGWYFREIFDIKMLLLLKYFIFLFLKLVKIRFLFGIKMLLVNYGWYVFDGDFLLNFFNFVVIMFFINVGMMFVVSLLMLILVIELIYVVNFFNVLFNFKL